MFSRIDNFLRIRISEKFPTILIATQAIVLVEEGRIVSQASIFCSMWLEF